MATIRSFIQRHPVSLFYILVFAISWGGLLLLAGIDQIPGNPDQVKKLFPLALVIMFAGPSFSGLLMTLLVSGKPGLRELLSRLLRWRIGLRWYAIALLTGPLLVAAILWLLSQFSSAFIPGIVTADDKIVQVLFGLGWGLVGGGLLEELGWTGFAVPRLRLRYSGLGTGLIVGLLWGVWHILIAFWSSNALAGSLSLTTFVAGFLAFYLVALPAYRILLVWVHDRTNSLVVVMLMHAFLSASTLILQPQGTSGYLTWNIVVAAALWLVVAAAAVVCRRWR